MSDHTNGHKRGNHHPNRDKRGTHTPSDQDRYACHACHGQSGVPLASEGPTTVSEQKLAYSVTVAAEMVGVSRRTCYELIASGQLLSVKIGRRRLVRHADLAAFVDNLDQGEAVA